MALKGEVVVVCLLQLFIPAARIYHGPSEADCNAEGRHILSNTLRRR